MFWVYILRCADGSYYTGHTDNLEKRMNQYRAGEVGGYMASRLPAELVWTQECDSRIAALVAERQIKGWSRRKKEAMMGGDWNEVARLSRGVSSVHPSTSPARGTPVGTPPLRGDPFAGSGRTALLSSSLVPQAPPFVLSLSKEEEGNCIHELEDTRHG